MTTYDLGMTAEARHTKGANPSLLKNLDTQNYTFKTLRSWLTFAWRGASWGSIDRYSCPRRWRASFH